MRGLIIAGLAAACAGPALAETCEETFVRVFTDRAPKGPIRIDATQEVKGAKPSRNITYQTGTGDWMTEMVDPPGMPWTLVAKDVMYMSTDRGKSWKKLRTVDSAQNMEASLDALKAAAKDATGIACGREEMDGIAYDTIQADYVMAQYNSAHTDKYWIDPGTGWVRKLVTRTRMSGYETTATQLVEKAPGLKLPAPD